MKYSPVLDRERIVEEALAALREAILSHQPVVSDSKSLFVPREPTVAMLAAGARMADDEPDATALERARGVWWAMVTAAETPLREGMVRWDGYKYGPSDWDQGPVLLRNGTLYEMDLGSSWSHDHTVVLPSWQVIGYTPRERATPAGMKAWNADDAEGPSDWDGGPVLFRCGDVGQGPARPKLPGQVFMGNWEHGPHNDSRDRGRGAFDVVAYRPMLPLAERSLAERLKACYVDALASGEAPLVPASWLKEAYEAVAAAEDAAQEASFVRS